MKKKLKFISFAFLLFALVLGVPGMVFGVQDIVLDSDLNIDLTSPSTTLVIASGATMDSLVVNAGNVVITMSEGNFPITITSADRYQFAVTGIPSVGTTCGSSASTTILPAQGTAVAVTLTPTTICVSGGGGGGGFSAPAPEPEEEVLAEEPAAEELAVEEPAQETSTPETAELVAIPSLPLNPTIADIQVVIDAILANIQVLLAELANLEPTTLAEVPLECSGISFTRALTSGSTGSDVLCLQTLLNQNSDTQVALSGVGSTGNETNYFGDLTAAAVGKLQIKYGVVADSFDPGYSYVGPKTRAQLNSLLGQ